MTGKHRCLRIIFVASRVRTFEQLLIFMAYFMYIIVKLVFKPISTLVTFYFGKLIRNNGSILIFAVWVNWDVLPVQAYVWLELQFFLRHIAGVLLVFYTSRHGIDVVKASRYLIFKSTVYFWIFIWYFWKIFSEEGMGWSLFSIFLIWHLHISI